MVWRDMRQPPCCTATCGAGGSAPFTTQSTALLSPPASASPPARDGALCGAWRLEEEEGIAVAELRTISVIQRHIARARSAWERALLKAGVRAVYRDPYSFAPSNLSAEWRP